MRDTVKNYNLHKGFSTPLQQPDGKVVKQTPMEQLRTRAALKIYYTKTRVMRYEPRVVLEWIYKHSPPLAAIVHPPTPEVKS
jgi:hypothetical protein